MMLEGQSAFAESAQHATVPTRSSRPLARSARLVSLQLPKPHAAMPKLLLDCCSEATTTTAAAAAAPAALAEACWGKKGRREAEAGGR